MSAVDAVFGAYHFYRKQHYDEAAVLLVHALESGLVRKYEWAASSLLGLSYHYQSDHLQDWFSKAEAVYLKALASSPGPVPTAILAVNYGFLLIDRSEGEKAIDQFEKALTFEESLRENSLVGIVASLGLAVALTLEAVANPEAVRPRVSELVAKIDQPEKVRYLFKDESIPSVVLDIWKNWNIASKFLA